MYCFWMSFTYSGRISPPVPTPEVGLKNYGSIGIKRRAFEIFWFKNITRLNIPDSMQSPYTYSKRPTRVTFPSPTFIDTTFLGFRIEPYFVPLRVNRYRSITLWSERAKHPMLYRLSLTHTKT